MMRGKLFASATGAVISLAASCASAGYLTPVYVSTAGVDGSDCGTVAAPCRTLDGALLRAPPTNGVVYLVRPGDYGPAQINKSVKIINVSGGRAGVLNFGSSAVGLTINRNIYSAKGVTLQGLTIDGANVGGGGVSINGVTVSISRCEIKNLVGSGISIGPAGWYTSGFARIVNTTITHAGVGVQAFAATYHVSVGGVLDGVEITDAGRALGIDKVDRLIVSNSTFEGNAIGAAIGVRGALVIDGIKAVGNDQGVSISRDHDASKSYLARSTIAGGRIGLQTSGLVYTFRNNLIEGNTTDMQGSALNPAALQ
jgi:hypothetical protein